MANLIRALNSGSGMCDTRLCEEVMQEVGLPLSGYAQAHPEIVAIRPARIGADESSEIILKEAKEVLKALMNTNEALSSEAPPAVWRARLATAMEEEHPRVAAEEVEKQARQIESEWESFYEIVAAQCTARK